MKKLAIALAGALFLTAATPVFACPHDDAGTTETQAPKTADKTKSTDKAKTTETTKAKATKDTAKKKTDDKKDETVSMK